MKKSGKLETLIGTQSLCDREKNRGKCLGDNDVISMLLLIIKPFIVNEAKFHHVMPS